MKTHRITVEQALFLLVFLLALGLRLLRLGAAPLSDSEADLALQALEIARAIASGERAVGPQPGYVLLTGLTFFLFGSSNALARIWPALAGSLLVWFPYLFRHFLERYPFGRKAALIVAVGLALDPGLVALSRLAGGPMLAIGFGLLALGWAYQRRPFLAGMSGGLALLGGPAALHGAFGLALAWGAGSLLERLRIRIESPAFEPDGPVKRSLNSGVLAAGGTILLAGTLFLRVPQGLGALAGAIPAYLAGWAAAPVIPVSRLLAALVFYEALPLALGLVGAIRSWWAGNGLSRWLSLWILSALLLALLYPGRQAGDLGWVLVPFWSLAGLELARHLEVNPWERLPALGQAALVVLLLALAWINLAGLGQLGTDLQAYRLRWAVIGGTFFLGTVTSLLIALGWSPTAAERGLAWGTTAGLGLYLVASTWSVSQLRPDSPVELWAPPPTTQQEAQLLHTMGDLSEWRTGHRNMLDVVVVSAAPSLRWALRDWERISFRSDLAAEALPALVIQPGDLPPPSQSAAYRGQDFGWWVYPGWEGGLPADWPDWLVFRAAPERRVQLILWARADLFPGGSLGAVGEPTAPGSEAPAP
jgi:hypothetical protein